MSFSDSESLHAYRPATEGREDPLPDLRQFALSQRVRIGGRTFTVRVGPINQRVPLEPDTELVHVWALMDDTLVTCADLGLREPHCSHAWSSLTTVSLKRWSIITRRSDAPMEITRAWGAGGSVQTFRSAGYVMTVASRCSWVSRPGQWAPNREDHNWITCAGCETPWWRAWRTSCSQRRSRISRPPARPSQLVGASRQHNKRRTAPWRVHLLDY